MPSVTLAIPQTEHTVTRYAVKGVVADLMARMGVPRDTDVIYKEPLGQPPTTGGTVNETTQVKLRDDNHWVITHTEEYQETGLVHASYYHDYYPYIYNDPYLGIAIRPTYVKVESKLNGEIYFRDKSQLESLQRRLRIQEGARELTGKHELRYEYSLPDDVLVFLHDVHSMLLPDPVTGAKPSLQEYLSQNFAKGLARRRTVSGDTARLILEEIQGNVQGLFTDELFYKEVEVEEGMYRLNFEYTIKYRLIVGITLFYQNVVHNQRIPVYYRKKWYHKLHREYYQQPSVQAALAQYPPLWRQLVNGIPRGMGGYRLDPTDLWDPPYQSSSLMPVLIAPLMVNETDPHEVCQLSDLTDEQLPPFIRHYLTTLPEASLEYLASPVLLQVFSEGYKNVEVTVTLSASGEVRSVLPMDPRNRHYLVISLQTDFAKLPNKVVTRMLNEPEPTIALMQSLDPRITVNGVKSRPPIPEPRTSESPTVTSYIGDVYNPNASKPLTKSGVTWVATPYGKRNSRSMTNTNAEWLEVIGNKKITHNSFRQTVKGMKTTNSIYKQIRENNPRLLSYNTITVRRSE